MIICAYEKNKCLYYEPNTGDGFLMFTARGSIIPGISCIYHCYEPLNVVKLSENIYYNENRNEVILNYKDDNQTKYLPITIPEVHRHPDLIETNEILSNIRIEESNSYQGFLSPQLSAILKLEYDVKIEEPNSYPISLCSTSSPAVKLEYDVKIEE